MLNLTRYPLPSFPWENFLTHITSHTVNWSFRDRMVILTDKNNSQWTCCWWMAHLGISHLQIVKLRQASSSHNQICFGVLYLYLSIHVWSSICLQIDRRWHCLVKLGTLIADFPWRPAHKCFSDSSAKMSHTTHPKYLQQMAMELLNYFLNIFLSKWCRKLGAGMYLGVSGADTTEHNGVRGEVYTGWYIFDQGM